MLVPARPIREARVVDQLGQAERATQARELFRLHRGDLDPVIVDRSVQPVARVDPRLVGVEAWTRNGDAVDEHRVGRQHRGAVEQRRPQLLALAGAALVIQRGETPDHRQHRVGRVGHPETDVEGLVAFAHRARLVLETGRRLEDRIEPAEVRLRSLEAVRPGVAVHDVGIDALAVFVRDPETLRDPGGHVVVDDVGPLDELQRDLFAPLRLDVEADVALATRAAHERLVDHPHAVAGHGLDLDHLGTEITEDHRSERTGEVLTEVDDQNPFERLH